MPYRRRGKVVFRKKGGKWEAKQQCRTVDNAKAAMRILRSLEAKE